MDNYNYPEGTDNPSAPWNIIENDDKTVEVTVSMTISKTMKIDVQDYSIEEEKDEDGHTYKVIDYTNCDLKRAVMEQRILPNEAYKTCLKHTQSYDDLKDWVVDDFEVILE